MDNTKEEELAYRIFLEDRRRFFVHRYYGLFAISNIVEVLGWLLLGFGVLYGFGNRETLLDSYVEIAVFVNALVAGITLLLVKWLVIIQVDRSYMQYRNVVQAMPGKEVYNEYGEELEQEG